MWHNLELDIQTLEAETINDVYENIQFLKDKLEEYGYTVATLDVVNAQYNTYIANILTQLQNVENDLTDINADVTSIYYKSHREIAEGQTHRKKAYFNKEAYDRWVNVLNDLYEIIIDGKGVWGVLRATDGVLRNSKKSTRRTDVVYAIRGDTLGS